MQPDGPGDPVRQPLSRRKLKECTGKRANGPTRAYRDPMKGIVFNIAQEVVVADHGEDTWDDLLDEAGVDGSYTALGDYPQSELMGIVAAAARRWDMAPEDVVRHVGRNGLAEFVQRYPDMARTHESSRTFLLALNSVIHPEVRKLYPGAHVPHFEFNDTDTGGLRIRYVSERGLCHLAEGLILGAADHFGESVTVTQPMCRHRGDSDCFLDVEWTRDG